tara:strand:+ start:2459 stop:2710 length:252 start_codon:yes stop_codon:yes gene_type:complete
MKKGRIIKSLIVLVALSFISCEKESDYGSDCNCGDISNDGVSGNSYWVEVRNYCTGGKKKVYMDQDLWMNAHVGEMRCYSSEW